MNPIDQFTRTRRNLPHWQSPGSIYFLTWRCRLDRTLDPPDRTLTLESIRYWDGQRWAVFSAVVMPDHCHALVKPLPVTPNTATGVFSLADVLESVKGFSARAINKRQERAGPVWQDERYDRIVRDDEEFESFWEYVRANAVKAGLVNTPEDYPWLYTASVRL
jgi:REP element-mobilizing transposase RayT